MSILRRNSLKPHSLYTDPVRAACVETAEHAIALPQTTAIDAEKAMRSLDHAEMLALAGMYERWALSEEDITPDQRTKLIVWSADYERVAAHVGERWTASDPQADDPIAFMAKLERRATR